MKYLRSKLKILWYGIKVNCLLKKELKPKFVPTTVNETWIFYIILVEDVINILVFVRFLLNKLFFQFTVFNNNYVVVVYLDL